MQQTCHRCGYQSPDVDKFCRQCGAQQSAESEFSSATTLNHGKAEPTPPMAGVGTGRFPPNVGDAITGETERYYYAPQYAPAPVNIVHPPNYLPSTSSSFSWLTAFTKFLKGTFLFIIFAGLLAATASAVFFSQEAQRERDRRHELETKARARVGGDNANGRAQGAWGQMEEALQLAQEAAEKAAGAGATLTISGEKPIDLHKFAYPGAQVEAMIGSRGNEALALLTQQNFDTVRSFYERQFGKPVLQVVDRSQDNGRKKLLFQSSTLPPVLIRVEEIEESQVKITILHSLLRFPRTDDVQSQ